LWIEFTDHAPDFIALRVEENKGGCEIKIINRRKFPADIFLDV